ncbi:MAG TPA: lipopolysaccharide heptosyltransferase II [Solimonas sp.]|nr:lipopolysaccharide heptosyltransferase II [Solimonas sp.]
MSDQILVIGPSWVGDMVMAQALFMRLKQRRPGCEIDVLAPGWSQPILARMREVRDALEMPLGHGQFHWSQRRELGRALRERRYDQAIVLPGSWKSALVPYFARIPRRTGYRGEMRLGLLNDIRKLDKKLLRTTPERFVALALDRSADAVPLVPIPRLAVDIARASQLMLKLGLDANRPAVGLMPGAEYGPAKQWPPQFYADLAKQMAAAGVQSWIFGSAKERELGEHIRQLSSDAAVNLCGQTALVDLVDLIAQCRAVVCNDSGPLHIAAATGVPVVAIYGSSTPDHTPPLTEAKAVHYLRLECSPCFERTCKFGHYDCLFRIEPHAVRASLRKLAGL